MPLADCTTLSKPRRSCHGPAGPYAEVETVMMPGRILASSAGLIACYKGISVDGGPAGVGNAVNETVVFTFMVLFAINVIVTAVGIQFTV